MKMWKKILMGVAVLGVVGAGLLTFGIVKVGDMYYAENIKPDMQNYVQMTTEEQDKYIMTRMDDLLKGVMSKDQSLEVKMESEAIARDDDSRQAAIELGRSICAAMITADEDITTKLSPEAMAMYQKEEQDMTSRSQHFEQVLQKYVDTVNEGK